MCGIFTAVSLDKHFARQCAGKANDIQKHRGPDSVGVSVHPLSRWNVALSHQRLSILDLSDAGRQPMVSDNKRWSVVYNGEIYNYLELAEKYGLSDLKSTTDTEVLLELVASIGIDATLKELNGMWAIALLDHHEQKLYLSRDRLGIKPLYYTFDGHDLLVSSELKTLLQCCRSPKSLNARKVCEFLELSLQDTDAETMLEGIFHFPPAHYCCIDLQSDLLSVSSDNTFPYWVGLDEIPAFEGSEEEYIAQLEILLQDAIRLRMRADVPIGMTLSGGLDSSIIAFVLKDQINGKEQSFTAISAVSPGSEADESHFIDLMDAFLKLDVKKVELMTDESSLPSLIEHCTYHNDAPITSFSNILFYLLMKQAKDCDTKVIFSGQGADELFCGYKKYPAFAIKQWLQEKKWFTALSFLASFLLNRSIFNQFNIAEAKRYLPKWGKRQGSTGIIDSGFYQPSPHKQQLQRVESVQQRQWLDIKCYSVPYLTHYEDRLSMALAREIRLPFLDYRLVQLALSAPTSFKMASGWTKLCLRKTFSRWLPQAITWRKDKQGFVNPQEEIVKRHLRQAMEHVLSSDESLIFTLNIVDKAKYKDLFNRFCQGDKSVWFREVFAPYSLEIWLRQNREYINQ